MKIYKNTVFLFLVSISFSLMSQSNFGLGKWRLHTIFGSVKHVVKTNSRVYAQSNSGLYYYDINEQSLVELNKVDGLSSNQFSSIGYDASTNTLIIGYIDGDVDLVTANTITNINSIKKSNISGSKTINHIQAKGGKAYLSTDFGLLVLNLRKKEVAETYRSIGSGGANVSVTYSEISSTDSLYILTNEGLKVANAGGQYNLLDGSSWESITFTNGAVEKFHLFKNQLIALIDKNKLYKKTQTGEEKINVPEYSIRTLSSSENSLFVSYNTFIYQYSSTGSKTVSNHENIKETNDVIFANNQLWTGNNDGSITKLNLSNSTTAKYKINGLSSSSLWKGRYTNGKLMITGGGYDNYVPSNKETMVHLFDENWQTQQENLRSVGFFNAVDVAYNPSQGKYYIASYRGGIVEWDGKENFKAIDHTTVPFVSAIDGDSSYIKLTSLAMSGENMWVTNHETRNQKSIHKMDRLGNWTSYKLNSVNGSFPEEVQVDQNGILWIKIGGTGAKSGMVFYNPETGQERYLTTALNSGGLPHWKVNDFAIDKENIVWMGTGQGAASFQNTNEIFNNRPYNAVKPIVGGRPLLQDELITSVAVDGGNRKWFGTNNGVFLFDDKGEKAIKAFNVNNSPLPSNVVRDITINEKTGEVFIITSSGVASYWSDATESTGKHENVEVFPNPVPPNYDGMVAIRGLATDALVKITDVAGRLVYETNAEGGQAVWNGKDINGNKVRTGVYLIFSSSIEGEERFAGKFAVVE